MAILPKDLTEGRPIGPAPFLFLRQKSTCGIKSTLSLAIGAISPEALVRSACQRQSNKRDLVVSNNVRALPGEHMEQH